MRKILVLLFVYVAILGCGPIKQKPEKVAENKGQTVDVVDPTTYANTITATELKEMLYTYASDEFEGRKTGEPGQKKAVEYIKNYYISEGIPSPLGDHDYFQDIPKSFFRGGIDSSENVVAYIKGSEKPDEVLVISAHLDHLGIINGEIYNGADDDGSGTIAVLEIAEAFEDAVKDGHKPKRSILFLNLTGEEEGLYGSKYYTANPIFPLENTIADLNIDMVGRVDPSHENNKNYIYLIGADKLSTELNEISEMTNEKYIHLNLDYTYNDENDPNRFYYRSDHYNFAKHNVPVIFYFNGTHADYHKPSDTPDKIEYDIYATRVRLIFYTAWELANREQRIVVDKAKTE